MLLNLLKYVLFLGSFAGHFGNFVLAAPQPVRGVWVANVGTPTLDSPEAIRDFVALAERVGVNTLYVVVWNRGLTTYPSGVMQREFGKRCDPRYSKFDVLKEFTVAGHARKMRVIAWFEFGFASSYGDPNGGHILNARPNWAARDIHGQIASKNNFQWMNAFYPDVQDFVLSLVKEVLLNYDVDGVQGDDRLPACPSIAGYDSHTVELYRQQHAGREPPQDNFDDAWIDWRAELLNQFMQRMHRELKEIRPNTVISAAPSIYPWSKQQYLQDWPTWLRNGWVDEVCPQVYREDPTLYLQELKKILDEQVNPDDQSKVFPGILVQTATKLHIGRNQLLEMVRANRVAGIEGEVIFYDAAVRDNPNWFKAAWSID